MKQPSFIQSLYYQQGVAQQPNVFTRQTPPRAKHPRGDRLSSVAQRWCLYLGEYRWRLSVDAACQVFDHQ